MRQSRQSPEQRVEVRQCVVQPEIAHCAKEALLQAFDALPPQATSAPSFPSVEVDSETVEPLRGLGSLE